MIQMNLFTKQTHRHKTNMIAKGKEVEIKKEGNGV